MLRLFVRIIVLLASAAASALAVLFAVANRRKEVKIDLN